MQSYTPETLKATTKDEADMQVFSDLSVLESWKRWKNKWSNARLPEAEASNYRKKMRSDTSETFKAKTKEEADMQAVADVSGQLDSREDL